MRNIIYYLPERLREEISVYDEVLTGIRMRPGQQVQLELLGSKVFIGRITAAEYESTLLALMGHSLYAREHELDAGYFMLPDGSRAGICGLFTAHGPRSVHEISSVYIRIAREVCDCAAGVIGLIEAASGTLIVSPPGKGKTTLLRDAARLLSCHGRNVCIIDERGEIASCINGSPGMNIGPGTDVITGLKKHIAIPLAVRSCAPDMIVTDEIGDEKDAAALADAVRCGISILASAHGSGLSSLMRRKALSAIIEEGLFDLYITLGPGTGEINEINDMKAR